MNHRSILQFLAAGVLAGSAWAAGGKENSKDIDYTSARLERRIVPLLAHDKITIDGALKEKSWAQAPQATHFIQSEPKEGTPATEDTEVRVLYDSTNLYFGITAYDSDPKKILINELKKDFTTDGCDAVEIILDTFHDRRNGFRFAVNPGGAKWDGQMVNEGRETNSSWDGIWYVKSQIIDRGWTAEVAIPFKTLRFSNASVQTWGMNFMRRLRRKNEESYWSPLPRIYKIDRVSMAGTLEKIEGIRQGNNLKIKPYVTTSLSQLRSAGVNDSSVKGDAGIDLKYGIGNGLTLDLTYNTDFSQVEADEQQINLTRFSLFFPEKREFFLENSGLFQFGTSSIRASSGGGGNAGGGGRALQSSASEDFILFFSRRIGLSNDAIPIPILGGGRLTGRLGRYELGLLNIQTQESGSTPAANFMVARFRRNILSNSDIGAMFINKNQPGGRFNRVAGVDANFRFFQNLNVSSMLAKTQTPDLKDQDLAGRFSINYRDKVWDVRSSYTSIQENFNDETGFVPRPGVRKWMNSGGLHLRPRWGSRWVREYYPHTDADIIRRQDGTVETRYFNIHIPFFFQNSAFLELGRNFDFERLRQPFKVRSDTAIPAGDYNFVEYFLLANTNRSRRLSADARVSTGGYYNGHRKSFSVIMNARLNYKFTGSLSWTHNRIDLPVRNFSNDLLSLRANYSFNTNVFLNALVQYNSTLSQWSSNVRFNIIHRPLSDFFFVYNERRDSLTGELVDRALVAKLTYMFAF